MRLILALPAVFAAAGCALGPVDMGVGPSTVSDACTSLLASVPVVVDTHRIRALTPERIDAAAWGDPPIVVICGTAPPPALSATSSLIEIGGVTWFAQPLTNGTAFFSVDRADTVEIRIPADYRPEASVVVELAPYVRDAIPESK